MKPIDNFKTLPFSLLQTQSELSERCRCSPLSSSPLPCPALSSPDMHCVQKAETGDRNIDFNRVSLFIVHYILLLLLSLSFIIFQAHMHD